MSVAVERRTLLASLQKKHLPLLLLVELDDSRLVFTGLAASGVSSFCFLFSARFSSVLLILFLHDLCQTALCFNSEFAIPDPSSS